MRSLSMKTLGMVLVAVVGLPVIALAGGGPGNLLLVVNADSPDSLAVANEYIALRMIPSPNVLHLAGLPTGLGANSPIGPATPYPRARGHRPTRNDRPGDTR